MFYQSLNCAVTELQNPNPRPGLGLPCRITANNLYSVLPSCSPLTRNGLIPIVWPRASACAIAGAGSAPCDARSLHRTGCDQNPNPFVWLPKLKWCGPGCVTGSPTKYEI